MTLEFSQWQSPKYSSYVNQFQWNIVTGIFIYLFIYLFILKVGVFRHDIINMCKMPSKIHLAKFSEGFRG
jgi:hypothetical protein